MNIKNNVRYRSTEDKIQAALFSLLRVRNYNDIYVKEICYEAGINRSSFYAHYYDINDLMLKTEARLSGEVHKIFSARGEYSHKDFVALFNFLKQNQVFYRAYVSTGQNGFLAQNDFFHFYDRNLPALSTYSRTQQAYHMAFFSGGLMALSKMWLLSGCKETPEAMAQILYAEYHDKIKYLTPNLK